MIARDISISDSDHNGWNQWTVCVIRVHPWRALIQPELNRSEYSNTY